MTPLSDYAGWSEYLVNLTLFGLLKLAAVVLEVSFCRNSTATIWINSVKEDLLKSNKVRQ